MDEKRLFALRGAAQCLNEKDDIRKQVSGLYDELLSRNDLAEIDIVSIIFSVTGDLDALNPATALRNGGAALDTALFVTREPDFHNSLERVIRVLIHCYLRKNTTPVNIYRNGAEVLRPER